MFDVKNEQVRHNQTKKKMFFFFCTFFLLVKSKENVANATIEEVPLDPSVFHQGAKNKEMENLAKLIKDKDVNEVRKIMKNFLKINDLDKAVLGDAANDEIDTREPCFGKANAVKANPNDDICVCKKGYIGDNPLTSRGCWTCRGQCHKEYGVCVYPGICECMPGFSGDGVECTLPIPVITKISAIEKSIIVYFEKTANFTPTHGYCRFGVPIVKGELTENSLHCSIPEDAGKFVSISFDKESWSDSAIYQEKDEMKESQSLQVKHQHFMKRVIYIILFLVIALATFGAIGALRKKNSTTDPGEYEVLFKNGQHKSKSGRKRDPQALL